MSDGFGSVDRPVRLYPFRRIVGVGWGGDPIVVATVTSGTPASPNVNASDFHLPIPPGVGEGSFDPTIETPTPVPRDAMKLSVQKRFVPNAAVERNNVLYATFQFWTDHYITSNLFTNTFTQTVFFNFKYVAKAFIEIPSAGQSNSFRVGSFPPSIYRAFPTFADYEVRGFRTGAGFTLRPDGTVDADRSPTWSFADRAETPLSSLGSNGPAIFIRFDKDGAVE